jgi:hypothetical protein
MSRDVDLETTPGPEEERFPLLATAINNPDSLPEVGLTRALMLERDGRLDVAAAAYAKLGHHEKAARLTLSLGARTLGARLLDLAGRRHEAAVLYVQMGDPTRALDCLVRQKVHQPGYAEACMAAIEMSVRRRVLSPALEALVVVFAARVPRSARETEAMLGLAQLMADHGRVPQAKHVLERILDAHPSHVDALARLEALEQAAAKVPASPRGEVARVPVQGPSAAPAEPAQASAGGGVVALRPGTVVGNRYRLGPILGRGGMGVVYKAEDLELQEDIALKVLTPAQGDPGSLARFKREGALARQMAHPNIVRVYDFGSGDGYRYITMELLVGHTLEQRLRDGLSLLDGARLLRQACLGLQAAHEQGVVHRDVKPDNMFINSKGVLKVMDFGLAKGSRDVASTGAANLLGTPRYMAPEQFAGGPITAAADIYSLGVVAYLLFTGTPPFDAPELLPLMLLHTQAPVPSLTSRNPHIPAPLERLVLHMLQKAPGDRPPDCNAVRTELEAACQTLGEDITRG